MRLLDRLDKIPPCVFRILAAENGVALGPDEIAKRSGLSRSTVQRISELKTWANVRIDVSERFVMGCGFDISNLKKPLRRLRILQERGLHGMKHLNIKPTAPLWKRGANANRIKFITRIITQQ